MNSILSNVGEVITDMVTQKKDYFLLPSEKSLSHKHEMCQCLMRGEAGMEETGWHFTSALV